MIRLLVDSMCDLPAYIREHPLFDMISLNVVVDGVPMRDKREITLAQVQDIMRSGVVPTTTAANPGDYLDYFTQQAKLGSEVIYLSFTSGLSSTYNTARAMLAQVHEKYPNFRCTIIDSKQSGGTIGLIAEQMIKMIEAGEDYDVIVEAARLFRSHVHFFFTLQDLKWLSKGGRIGSVTASVGDVFKIRPVVEVKDGKLAVVAKVRGDKRALAEIKKRMQEVVGSYKDQLVGIAQSDPVSSAELSEKMEQIADDTGLTRHERVQIGSVLCAHLGMTGTGIYFWDTDPKELIAEAKAMLK